MVEQATPYREASPKRPRVMFEEIADSGVNAFVQGSINCLSINIISDGMGTSERNNELTGLHREITDISVDFDPGFLRCI